MAGAHNARPAHNGAVSHLSVRSEPPEAVLALESLKTREVAAARSRGLDEPRKSWESNARPSAGNPSPLMQEAQAREAVAVVRLEAWVGILKRSPWERCSRCDAEERKKS